MDIKSILISQVMFFVYQRDVGCFSHNKFYGLYIRWYSCCCLFFQFQTSNQSHTVPIHCLEGQKMKTRTWGIPASRPRPLVSRRHTKYQLSCVGTVFLNSKLPGRQIVGSLPSSHHWLPSQTNICFGKKYILVLLQKQSKTLCTFQIVPCISRDEETLDRWKILHQQPPASLVYHQQFHLLLVGELTQYQNKHYIRQFCSCFSSPLSSMLYQPFQQEGGMFISVGILVNLKAELPQIKHILLIAHAPILTGF